MTNIVETLEVILVTYNHSPFIEDALASIEQQDYEGRFTVKVYDDGSKDDTVAKIKAFAERSRHSFKFVEHSKNLGVQKNYLRALGQIDSTYVAILEGDDFWIDARHLTSNMKKLDRYPKAAGSFSQLVLLDQFGTMTSKHYPHDRFIGCSALALDNIVGNFSSCVYRGTSIAKVLPRYSEAEGTDWLFNLLLADSSFLVNNRGVNTVYRIHASGDWSGNSEIQKYDRTIRGIILYDALFEGRYTRSFGQHRSRLERHKAAHKYLPKRLKAFKKIIMLLVPPAVWKAFSLFQRAVTERN